MYPLIWRIDASEDTLILRVTGKTGYNAVLYLLFKCTRALRAGALALYQIVVLRT
jgi:hypothetical protein